MQNWFYYAKLVKTGLKNNIDLNDLLAKFNTSLEITGR